MKKLTLLIILVIYVSLSFGRTQLFLNKDIRGAVSEITTTTYDCKEEFGELVKGKFTSSLTTYYDKQVFLIKSAHSDGDVFTYSYENNNTKKLEYKEDGTLLSVEECKLDPQDRSEICKEYDAYGAIKKATRYKYDDNGFVYSRISYDENGKQTNTHGCIFKCALERCNQQSYNK